MFCGVYIDIQEFYVHTLGDEYKPGYQKAAETNELATKWEGSNPPVPIKPTVPQQQEKPPQQQDDTTVTV